jgi:hypothetical protein
MKDNAPKPVSLCIVAVLTMCGLAGVADGAGNLHPAADELRHGRELLRWTQLARDLHSLTVADLGHLKIQSQLARPEREQARVKRRSYRILSVPAELELQGASYEIVWGATANNGAFLVLRIDDFRTCVTEELMREALGADFDRSISSLRHFAPNQQVPRGLRPHRDFRSYTLPNGLVLRFAFDFVCASEVTISQPQGVGWAPP